MSIVNWCQNLVVSRSFRLALAAGRFTVSPIPSHALLPCEVPLCFQMKIIKMVTKIAKVVTVLVLTFATVHKAVYLCHMRMLKVHLFQYHLQEEPYRCCVMLLHIANNTETVLISIPFFNMLLCV